MNFNFHLVYKRNSNRVKEFGAKPKLHVCQNNEEESSARSEFAVLSLKLLFFSNADDSIEKSSQSRNKFLMRIISAPFVFLFLPFFFNFKQVILRTLLVPKVPRIFIFNHSVLTILIFLLSFDNRMTIIAQRHHRHKISLN